MRIKLYFVTLVVIALTALTVGAQSNTFTYQGRLTDNNLAAVGTYEMQFRVFDAAVAGNQLPVGTPVTLTFTVLGTNPVTVSNGAFTVQLNFGNGVFTGADRWLEISVRKPSDPPGFTLLTPRQPITSSPYSIKTLNAASADSVSCNLCITDAQISGIDGGKVIGNVASATTAGNVSGVVAIANGGTGSSTQTFVDLANPQTITGAKIMSSATNVFTGSGAGLTNISPTNISPGTASINIAGIAAAPAVVTTGATPSVAGRTMLTLNYPTATAITDLTDGVDGQCVVLLSLNNNISFTNGANFRLTNRFTQSNLYISSRLFSDSTLTVCRSSASGSPIWYETARAINPVVIPLSVSVQGNGSGTVTSTAAEINCSSTGGVGCFSPVANGEVITLTAAPNPGSIFTGWSGGGCSGTSTCTVTASGSFVSVTANFVTSTQLLTVRRFNYASYNGEGTLVSDPAGINCTFGPNLTTSGTCSVPMPYNSTVTLTFTPAVNTIFEGYQIGPTFTAGNSATLTMDQPYIADLILYVRSLNVSVVRAGTASNSGTITSTNSAGASNISCGSGSNCSRNFPYGTSVTLTATTSATFSGWSGGECSGTGTCTFTVTQNVSITGTFDSFQTLTVTKSGTGGGTVASDPAGISCGADCTEDYISGTVVTLTATPDFSSTFAGWSGACTGTGTCLVTMSTARNVTATFSPLLRNLSVSKTGAGSGTVTSNPAGINCGTTCSADYVHTTVVTLTATPSSGASQFAGWTGCDSTTGNSCTVSMNAARSVIANFIPNGTLPSDDGNRR